jgi:hypothetical protein
MYTVGKPSLYFEMLQAKRCLQLNVPRWITEFNFYCYRSRYGWLQADFSLLHSENPQVFSIGIPSKHMCTLCTMVIFAKHIGM